MKNKSIIIIVLLGFILFITSCNNSKKDIDEKNEALSNDITGVWSSSNEVETGKIIIKTTFILKLDEDNNYEYTNIIDNGIGKGPLTYIEKGKYMYSNNEIIFNLKKNILNGKEHPPENNSRLNKEKPKFDGVKIVFPSNKLIGEMTRK